MRSTKKQPKKQSKTNRRFNGGLLLLGLGSASICIGLGILLLTFYPLIKADIQYKQLEAKPRVSIAPVDRNFGIVIPKIGANASVIQDVNPLSPEEYQVALSKGVAHARGTAYPGQRVNIFLFAHSAENWYMANRYNAIFFLLYKLEPHDEISLYYHNVLHRYEVTKKMTVSPNDVQYLTTVGQEETLTLMTCWPPGTTLQRYIITAKPM